MFYRLGLDVGTNSLGWSVLELDEDDKTTVVKVVNAGARIFTEGRDDKSKATLAADRRQARSARRRRDRFKQRQTFLLCELEKAGLMPSGMEERRKLQECNPLELRARALCEALTPHQVGRALFHLNQRRGFKSNRKDRSKEERGKISDSVLHLMQEMRLIEVPLSKEEYKKLDNKEKKRARDKEADDRRNAMQRLAEDTNVSYGAFLWKRQCNKMWIRARPGAGEDGKLYHVYPTREFYEDEFQKIWTVQERHHPELMTDEARQRIHRAIFHQRPLKPQKLGKCVYISSEDRTFKAMPSFQRYRIYQEVNNLTWSSEGVEKRLRDHLEMRNKIVKLLEEAGTLKVGFKKMKREVGISGDVQFNFETFNRDGFESNPTTRLMQDKNRVGEDWRKWPLDKQDRFICIILNGTPEQQQRNYQAQRSHKPVSGNGADEDREIAEYLCKEFGLAENAAEECLKAPLPEGTANISLKAAKLMLKKMEHVIRDQETGEETLPIQPEAARAVAEENPGFFVDPLSRSAGSGEGDFTPEPYLPYYGKLFEDGRHIIPGDKLSQGNDLKYYGGVTNPTVHIALNQIRQVVNELIDRYGHPYSIAIELARDLPLGAEKRREREREQGKNRKRNEKLNKTLKKHGYDENHGNRLRLRLWEDQEHLCPFSGRKIGVCQLFTADIEVEHLLPYSFSLDDSLANKVVCFLKANRDKGNRTPHEAFGDSPGDYNWHDICERVKKLPPNKHWRFEKNARDTWKRDHDEPIARHLNDTRYIGRLAREYLECVCPVGRIDVITGRLTALLRSQWGLNGMLRNDDELSKKKNRDDHRHHAIDAIVVGMTSRSMLQKVSKAAKRSEELLLDDRLFPPGGPITWESFRTDVDRVVRKIIVSHKVRHKKLRPGMTDGKLHNETAYGIVKSKDESKDEDDRKVVDPKLCEVVVRKPLDTFKELAEIQRIRDPYLRKCFSEEFKIKGFEGVKEFAQKWKIRRLRMVESLSVIPVKDRAGKEFKAYKSDSNWGMEIYAYPDKPRWDGMVISRFAANQAGFKPGETYRPHPASRLVMRLQINDCIELDEQGGERRILRLQQISKGQLTFAPLNEANVDARHRNKQDPFRFLTKSPDKLRSLDARKVHVSPTGRVRYENRRRPRSARRTP